MADLEDDYGAQAHPPLTVGVAELAERQWGVVSLAQLRGVGVGQRMAGHWLETGRLRPLHRGVYAVGHAVLRPEGTWLAAVFACGESAVLSHASAAALWGFRPRSLTRVDVTGRRGREQRPGIRVHSARSLQPRDVTTHDGIPVTSVARTLLDLASSLSPGALESAVARADQMRVIDWTDLEDMLARGNGHRGRAKLARIVSGDPKITREGLSRRFLELVRSAGLPEPEVEVPFTLGGGEEWVLDVLWRRQKVTVELDDWGTHRVRRRFELDRQRAAKLTAAGYRHLQFTWRQILHEPEWVIATLRAVLSPRP